MHSYLCLVPLNNSNLIFRNTPRDPGNRRLGHFTRYGAVEQEKLIRGDMAPG